MHGMGSNRRTAAGIACLVSALTFSVAARAAGGNVLTVGLLSEPASLNPLAVTATETRDIVELLYLKLLEEQPDFVTFQPQLARSWEYSADSLSITFHLRDDVRWTDGTPVTAEDVRFTWQLEVDTVVAWTSAHLKAHIRDVEVRDPLTAIFHFDERYPYQLMDANDGVILPGHILAGAPRADIKTHFIGRRPVGNGPYRLARWEPARYIELGRNPDYHEAGIPRVERVVFEFVPDMVTLMTRLKKGEIDLLESVPSDQVRPLQEAYPEVRVYTYPSRGMTFVGWNVERAPFADREIRRALTMAIDRKEIIETVWAGNGMECRSPVHAILWAFDDAIEPLPHDPDAARAALDRLGWSDSDGDGVRDRDGKPFEFELITNYGSQQRVDVATMVEADLRKIGVIVRIRTLEFGTFIDRVMSAEFDACVLGWKTATKPDITGQWHSGSVPPNGYNISHYRNPLVDDLIARAAAALDQGEARALWSSAQRIIYEDQPFTFIAIPYEVTAVRDRFCNVQPNAISALYHLREWRLGANCP